MSLAWASDGGGRRRASASRAEATLWMLFDDFVEQFDDLYICRLAPSAWHAAYVSGEWRADTARGCTIHAGAEHNPQFMLTLVEPTRVWLVLTQGDARGTDRELFFIHLLVAEVDGERVGHQPLLKSALRASTGKYINFRQVACEATLEPRPKPFTVFVSTFLPDEEATFVVSVFSERPVELKPMQSPTESSQE